MHPEYEQHLKEASELKALLKQQREQLANRYQQRRRWGNIWQTVVVLATALSTALAGYQAHDGIDIRERLLLAIIVALTGTVTAIRDAWRVSEMLNDARERYSEIRLVWQDLDKALFQADRASTDEDRLRLGVAVRYARSRYDDIADELADITPPPAKKELPA
jgi:hypothetical protein